jgi:hypothetical protein
MRRSTRPRQILALVGIQVDIQATEKKSEIARASGLSAFLECVLVCSCRRVAALERVTEVECMYVLWTFPSNSVTITPSRRFKSAPMERRHVSHASSTAHGTLRPEIRMIERMGPRERVHPGSGGPVPLDQCIAIMRDDAHSVRGSGCRQSGHDARADPDPVSATTVTRTRSSRDERRRPRVAVRLGVSRTCTDGAFCRRVRMLR